MFPIVMTPLNIDVKAHIIIKTAFFSSENKCLLVCSKFTIVQWPIMLVTGEMLQI